MSQQEDNQGKLVLYQMLQAELEELKRQNQMVDGRMIELETSIHALTEMNDVKKDNETLIPLGSGCYAHSRVKTDEVLLDIGAGVMVTRSLISAKNFLKEREKEIEQAGKKIHMQSEDIVNNLNKLTPEVQKIVMEAQAHRKG